MAMTLYSVMVCIRKPSDLSEELPGPGGGMEFYPSGVDHEIAKILSAGCSANSYTIQSSTSCENRLGFILTKQGG